MNQTTLLNSLPARLLRRLPSPTVSLIANISYFVGIIPDAIYHFSGAVTDSPTTWQHLWMVSWFIFSFALLWSKAYVDQDTNLVRRHLVQLVSSIATLLAFILDYIGHSIWGVEASIDAIFSFTHVALVISICLNFAGAIIAAWKDKSTTKMPISTVISTSLLFGFLNGIYLNLFNPFAQLGRFDSFMNPSTAVLSNEPILWTIASPMLQTFVVLTILFRLLRRWSLPPLSVAFFFLFAFGVPTLLFNHLYLLPITFLTGLCVDVLLFILKDHKTWRSLAVGTLTPLLLWGFYLLALQPWNNQGHWSLYLYSGFVALPLLVGLFCGISDSDPNL